MRWRVCLLTFSSLCGSPLWALDPLMKGKPVSVIPPVVSAPIPRYTPYYGYYPTQWRVYPSGSVQTEFPVLPTNPHSLPTLPTGLLPSGKVLDTLPAVVPSPPTLPELPPVPKSIEPNSRGPVLILPQLTNPQLPSQIPRAIGPSPLVPRPSFMPPMFSQRRLILPPPTLPPDAGEVYPPLERPSSIQLPPIIPSAGEMPEPLAGEAIGKPARLPDEILELKNDKPATLGRPIEDQVKPILPSKPEEKIVPEWPNIRRQ